MEYVSLEGCELTTKAYSMPQRPHPILRWTSPQRPSSPSTIFNLEARIHNSIGGSRGHHNLGAHIHNSIGGSQEHTTPSRVKDPRVTSSQTLLQRILVERANRCNQCKWQEHKCSNPSLSNSTQSNKCLWGTREEEQRRTQQMNLQDLDPTGSPP